MIKLKESGNMSTDGSIPNWLIHQIEEYSLGGFVLFYFNPKTQAPEQVGCYDSPTHCLAMQKYIDNWGEAIHDVSLGVSINNIQTSLQERENGDEE